MSAADPNEVTELLVAWRNGDSAALDALTPLIYRELHRLAHHYMQQQAPGHTLQTTALVHEAYLRMVRQQEVEWQNRAHFFAASAQAMRHILVDMARSRGRQRRGGGARALALDEALIFSHERAAEVVALDDALTALAKLDARKSRIVELRFFAGLTTEETAAVLKLSHATIEREWQRARAWLATQMDHSPHDAATL